MLISANSRSAKAIANMKLLAGINFGASLLNDLMYYGELKGSQMYSLKRKPMAEYLRPAFAIILPNLGGFAGLFVTRSNNSRNWYQNLNKPSWRPAGGVIGPIWTFLYCTMGYASYLVWRDGGGFDGEARLPLAIFGTQLALNWAWTPIFFGAKKLDLATIEMGALWGVIVATIVTFKPINKTASYLLLPYLGWISVASCINYYIWMNNKDRQD